MQLLIDSLKVYSPSTRESELASYLHGAMTELGYAGVRTDSAGNLVGEIGAGETSLLLCGHMDTVPGELPVRQDRGRIYGRGASDAKSALCALLVAGARSSDAGVRVFFAGARQEESDSLGVRALARSGRKFDYAIFGEPAGASRITVGYRGRVTAHVTLETGSGHAGSPWARRSAVDEFTALLSRLKKFERLNLHGGDHFRSVSISTTLLRAGTFHNVLPGLCEATFDVRIPPGLKSAEVVAEIAALSRDVRPGTSVKVEFDEPTEAYQSDPNSVPVRALQRGIILRLRAKPALIRKTGTGDMNSYAAGTGTECVTYGPGDSRESHTSGEVVAIKDYLDSVEVLTEAIRQIRTLHAARTSGR